MKAEKISHKDQSRIRIDFPYNRKAIAKLRQIADSRWSRTMGAWHVPYTKEAYRQLKELFPDLDVSETEHRQNNTETQYAAEKKSEIIDEHPIEHPELNETTTLRTSDEQPISVKSNIEPEYTKSTIYLKIPKNETDIQYIRSFQYTRWDSNS